MYMSRKKWGWASDIFGLYVLRVKLPAIKAVHRADLLVRRDYHILMF